MQAACGGYIVSAVKLHVDISLPQDLYTQNIQSSPGKLGGGEEIWARIEGRIARPSISQGDPRQVPD